MSVKCKRGHGGVCLYIHENIYEGVQILERNDSGFIWVKLCKDFFKLSEDLCICFAYIPPQESVYFKMHGIGYFELLEAGIRKYSAFGKVGFVGDLNARCRLRSDIIENSHYFDKFIHVIDAADDSQISPVHIPDRSSMDVVCNASGIKLLDICCSTDLKIVNGRVGDDTGIGQYTLMSANGQSLIDYAVMSQDIFPVITNFVVHELHSCSTHVPIQINFKVSYELPEKANESFNIDKLIWDNSKLAIFMDKISSEINSFNTIVDKTVSSEYDIN